MNQSQRPSSISPHDSTLEVPVTDGQWMPGDTLSREPRLCGKFGLLEGSKADLSGQTCDLLRMRLRTAAAINFAAFGVFLLWYLIRTGSGNIDPSQDLPELFQFHLFAVCMLGVTCAVLFQPQALPKPALGFAELVIFGLPAAFFFKLNYLYILKMAEHGHPTNPLAPWLCIIMLYSMFIPNAWHRAALIVGTFAAAPIVLVAYLCATNAAVAEAISLNLLVEFGMIMAIVAVSATLGTHMIGTLRRHVFEARELGQYHLIRLLGEGGMGQVYLAEHEMLKRPCAVKLIRPDSAADPQALARFEREVRTTATLTHPNTIEIYDYGHTEDGAFYYVMEYLPGLTLSELVQRHGPLPPQRVVYLLRQACGALREAHAAGLIHRDIKPANIFVAERGGVYDVVKLLDFGLVKGVAKSLQSAQLTQEGMVAGSPLFMAPEQAMGQPADARGDIYSLGAVAYYLLTGVPPFEDDNAMKVIVSHARDPVIPPSKLRPEVPDDLERVVLKCLEKDPEHRYQSAFGIEEALALCESAGQWTAREAAAWWGQIETQLCDEP